MDAIVEMIYRAALPYHPCGQFTGRESLRGLMRKFLTAAGAEFCLRNDFPPRDICTMLKGEKVYEMGVFVDAGAKEIRNAERIAIVGASEFTLEYDTIEYPCRVILMKGARAHIKARGFSVVAIQAGKDCTYDIEKSGHAIVMET